MKITTPSFPSFLGKTYAVFTYNLSFPSFLGNESAEILVFQAFWEKHSEEPPLNPSFPSFLECYPSFPSFLPRNPSFQAFWWPLSLLIKFKKLGKLGKSKKFKFEMIPFSSSKCLAGVTDL